MAHFSSVGRLEGYVPVLCGTIGRITWEPVCAGLRGSISVGEPNDSRFLVYDLGVGVVRDLLTVGRSSCMVSCRKDWTRRTTEGGLKEGGVITPLECVPASEKLSDMRSGVFGMGLGATDEEVTAGDVFVDEKFVTGDASKLKFVAFRDRAEMPVEPESAVESEDVDDTLWRVRLETRPLGEGDPASRDGDD